MQTQVPLTEKIAVVLSGICYVFTVYSFFTQTTLVVLIFFILYSIFSAYAIYLAFLSRADTSEFQAMSEEIEYLNAENKDIREKMSNKLIKKEDELTALRSELDEFKKNSGELKKKNQRLGKALNELSKENEDIRERNLLPPGDEEDEKETIDIISTARAVIADMSEYAKTAELTVNISSTTDELMVCASSKRLEILFRNIIDNTIKYARRAGNLVITISTIGEDIFIVLKDNGEGLSEAETQHIFELNYQGSNRISGNGLGLAQAKAIVDYYGGTIYAKSTEGKGMGIYIQLPATAKDS